MPESVRHWHASPRSAVGFLIRAATIDSALIGPDRTYQCRALARPSGSRSRRCVASQVIRQWR